MADHNADWEPCAKDGCSGVRLPTGMCWVHAADTDLSAALKRLGERVHVDARGVPITKELLRRLLAAAPKNDHGRPVLTNPRFDRATFKGKATFKGGSGFYGTVFEGTASFGGATFQGDAGFYGATFEGTAAFHGATFKGEAWFDGATFKGEARFVEACFQRDAEFDRATFHGDAWFNRARVNYDADFLGATFQQARRLGPMLVRKSLRLDLAVFHQRAQVEVAAAAVCCRRAQFLAGVQLRVRWAQIVLDDADLAAPSILTGALPFQDVDEGRWARALQRVQATGVHAGQPRLVSVRRADVAGLAVAGVDMRACRFAGAHHLDQLRVEECDFAHTPRGWRWTTRQTIAEEHHWRATRSHVPAGSGHGVADSLPASTSRKIGRRRGWYRLAHRMPAWLGAEPPSPAQITVLYRALRKGREDSKDEPGAADFYYGEMEMRRHAKRAQIQQDYRRDHRGAAIASAAEAAILWLYWLVAGYGLRAWRALAALAMVIGLVGVGFSRVGFHHPHPSQVASWLYALQATVSLEGKARQLSGQLTLPGELLRVGLRFTGPVLLGLALLSIRSRVKR